MRKSSSKTKVGTKLSAARAAKGRAAKPLAGGITFEELGRQIARVLVDQGAGRIVGDRTLLLPLGAKAAGRRFAFGIREPGKCPTGEFENTATRYAGMDDFTGDWIQTDEM